MNGGPAPGLPGDGDLSAVIEHAGPGRREFARKVLAAAEADEAINLQRVFPRWVISLRWSGGRPRWAATRVLRIGRLRLIAAEHEADHVAGLSRALGRVRQDKEGRWR